MNRTPYSLVASDAELLAGSAPARKMPGTLVATVDVTNGMIDPALLRSEHRLDRFDGARSFTDTGPMLWSGSTSLAVSLTSPIACSGQAMTQALEPIYVWVSMTGWRVRGSATDLTVSARRAR